MTSRDDHQTNANHDAAIARWDDEGGASTSARSNTGVRGSKGVRSKRMVETTADLKADRAATENEKILECLGAAVIMLWGNLPTKIQRELFEHAASLADPAPTAPWKREIARFLHITRMMALKRRGPLPRHVVM